MNYPKVIIRTFPDKLILKAPVVTTLIFVSHSQLVKGSNYNPKASVLLFYQHECTNM